MNLTLAITIALAAVGCDLARNTLWPTTVTCASQTASDALFREVRALAEADGFADTFSDSIEASLEDLAASYGAQTIACILHELIDKYTPRGVQAAESEGQIEAARRSQRIARFLEDKNVEVSQ